jgi:hypothetical protein
VGNSIVTKEEAGVGFLSFNGVSDEGGMNARLTGRWRPGLTPKEHPQL